MEQVNEQPKFWESTLGEAERAELYKGSYKFITPSIILIDGHGYRFIDETQSDSYGPFPNRKECYDAATLYDDSL